MIEAIDEIGVTVVYPTVTAWSVDAPTDTIRLYSESEHTATVPGHWIVRIIPDGRVDPGVEASD